MKKSLIVRIGGRLLYLRNLALTIVFRLFPIRDNQVIMWSYYYTKYSCNPRALTEYILEQPENMKVIWAFREPERFDALDPRITKVKWKSVHYLYALCTSRFVVTNARVFTTACFRKRSGQIYIQTWHSSMRLKKIESDALEALDAYYVKCAKQDSAQCDLLISGSGFSTEIYKRAFWYNNEILECGTPRTDALVRLATAQPEATLTLMLYTVALVMMGPFLTIYTANLTDTNYIRPVFGLLLILGETVYCLRLPYYQMAMVVGHFRQIRKGSYVEAALNLAISILLVRFYGITGVAFGTLAAMIYRTTDIVNYSSKQVVGISPLRFYRQLAIYLTASMLSYVLCRLTAWNVFSYAAWFGRAFFATLLTGAVFFLFNLLFFRTELAGLLQISKNLLRKKDAGM